MMTLLGGLFLKALLPLALIAAVLSAVMQRALGTALQRLLRTTNPSWLLVQFWVNSSGTTKKFWLNFSFGLAFVVLIRIAQAHLPIIHTTVNGFGLDLINSIGYARSGLITLNQGSDGMIPTKLREAGFTVPEATTSYARIQFDEDYLRNATVSQGITAITSRTDILRVLEKAVASKARLIILDIDLAYAPYSDEGQTALRYFLQNHRCPAPPIILVRTAIPSSKTENPLQWAPTGFDNLNRYKDNAVLWASSSHSMDSDNKLRTTPLYMEAIGPLGQSQTLPSVTGLVASLLKQEDISACNESLSPIPVVLNQAQAQINYTLHPKSSDPDRLIAVSAMTLLQQPYLFHEEQLRDRVVIISASHHRSDDEHLTNVGWMQGDLFLLNAIESLQRSGPLKESSWITFLLANVPVLLIFAWIAARFAPVLGLLVATTVCLVVLMPISMAYYELGFWLDFGIPLIAIQVNQLVGELFQWLFKRYEARVT